MAKLTRVIQKVFGSTAPAGEIGRFGSLAAGAPVTTTDPADVQSLANYLGGWFSAVLGSNSPAIEDLNALCFLFSRQLAYLFQAGIPEWDAGTTYYVGSLVNAAGILYSSLTDNNTGNALTDTTNWKILGARVRTVTANDTATQTDNIIRCDATTGPFTETLPAAASSRGLILRVKNVSTNLNTVTVKGNGTELIDLSNTVTLNAQDAIEIYCNGTTWDIL